MQYFSLKVICEDYDAIKPDQTYVVGMQCSWSFHLSIKHSLCSDPDLLGFAASCFTAGLQSKQYAPNLMTTLRPGAPFCIANGPANDVQQVLSSTSQSTSRHQSPGNVDGQHCLRAALSLIAPPKACSRGFRNCMRSAFMDAGVLFACNKASLVLAWHTLHRQRHIPQLTGCPEQCGVGAWWRQ